MFLMGKKQMAAASPKKCQLDPEEARQRLQFLMSGVPEELKKQTATREAAQLTADYPPLPTVSHVQQVKNIITKRYCDFFLFAKKETSCVLFYSTLKK